MNNFFLWYEKMAHGSTLSIYTNIHIFIITKIFTWTVFFCFLLRKWIFVSIKTKLCLFFMNRMIHWTCIFWFCSVFFSSVHHFDVILPCRYSSSNMVHVIICGKNELLQEENIVRYFNMYKYKRKNGSDGEKKRRPIGKMFTIIINCI